MEVFIGKRMGPYHSTDKNHRDVAILSGGIWPEVQQGICPVEWAPFAFPNDPPTSVLCTVNKSAVDRARVAALATPLVRQVLMVPSDCPLEVTPMLARDEAALTASAVSAEAWQAIGIDPADPKAWVMMGTSVVHVAFTCYAPGLTTPFQLYDSYQMPIAGTDEVTIVASAIATLLQKVPTVPRCTLIFAGSPSLVAGLVFADEGYARVPFEDLVRLMQLDTHPKMANAAALVAAVRSLVSLSDSPAHVAFVRGSSPVSSMARRRPAKLPAMDTGNKQVEADDHDDRDRASRVRQTVKEVAVIALFALALWFLDQRFSD
jgi:hypothetical protein